MSTINLKTVFKRRDTLTKRLQQAADPINGGFSNLGNATEIVLHAIKDLDYSAVFKTLSATPKTNDAIRNIAWCIAGNVKPLREGKAIVPGVFPKRPTYVPIQINAVNDYKTFTGAIRNRLSARVLAGPGCPNTFEFTWSKNHTTYLAKHPKGLGFNTNAADKPFLSPKQLVGCRLYVEIQKAEDQLRTLRYKVTGSMRKYNEKLIDARMRRGFKCPNKYKHHCHDCHIGYDECPLGTHRLNHILKECSKCKQKERHDIESGDTVCVKCRLLDN